MSPVIFKSHIIEGRLDRAQNDVKFMTASDFFLVSATVFNFAKKFFLIDVFNFEER